MAPGTKRLSFLLYTFAMLLQCVFLLHAAAYKSLTRNELRSMTVQPYGKLVAVDNWQSGSAPPPTSVDSVLELNMTRTSCACFLDPFFPAAGAGVPARWCTGKSRVAGA